MKVEPTILVCDPAYPRKTVWLTETELPLVNLIRDDKGIGPVMILISHPALTTGNRGSEP